METGRPNIFFLSASGQVSFILEKESKKNNFMAEVDDNEWIRSSETN